MQKKEVRLQRLLERISAVWYNTGSTTQNYLWFTTKQTGQAFQRYRGVNETIGLFSTEVMNPSEYLHRLMKLGIQIAKHTRLEIILENRICIQQLPTQTVLS